MAGRLLWRVKQAVYAARSAPEFLFERECPICRFEGLFDPYGYPVRPEARCPRCRSMERHRLFRLWLDDNLDLVADKRVLHFAPEAAVASMVKPLAARYTTADLAEGRAELALNIERTGLDAGSFDVVICSHVLEHVDDAVALAELRRILVPTGLAILMVPIIHGWERTYEGADAATDAERFRHYGQTDHVRRYGADFEDRVRASGFALSRFDATPEDGVRYGLIPGEGLFLARN